MLCPDFGNYRTLDLFHVELMSDIYKVLTELGIPYARYDHPPFFTCEEADGFYSETTKGGGTCKNLFIRNRKGDRHYLVIVHSSRRVDLRHLEAVLGEKGLSLASAERLERFLGVKPGSVSPFGLVNDKNKEVVVVVERGLYTYDKLYFHPNVNTATLGISTAGFRKFMDSTGNRVIEIEI